MVIHIYYLNTHEEKPQLTAQCTFVSKVTNHHHTGARYMYVVCKRGVNFVYRIHLETSSVLLRQLPVELLKAPSGWHYAPASTVAASTKTTGNEDENGGGKNEFIAVRAQSVSIGKPDDFPSFGWDNEYGHLNVKVPDFEAQQYLTSNQDFLEFVEADGYNCRQYWSEEGWKWRCARKATHPTFWICTDGCQAGCDGDLNEHSHCTKTGGGQDGAFRYRAMFDVIDMPWSWPAETNYHEARAYCKWLGDNCRIITEAEFLAIQDRQSVPEDGVEHDVIFQPDATEKFNLNMSFCSSTPVDYYKKNSAGFFDTMGNVWQWTEDHFNGLPGAKFDYLYHDFSTPYYDGWHNLILGGSWISTGDSASSFARFWFRRHFFQHMGFRVVRSTNPPPVQLLSTQVYQPGAGFLDTELQVSNFLPEQRVKSFTPEFDLESSDMIKAQLHWDFAPKVKTAKTHKSLLEPMDKFDQDDIRSVVIRSPTKTSSSSTAGFWGELSSTVGTATKLVKSCEGRALVIGSGTGRMAMEVAKHHNNVLAIHPVARAIEISEMLQQGIIPKGPAVDGISLDGLVLPETEKKLKDVTFKQFLWVPLEMGKFDLVVLALLDIATCPEYWISRLADIVAKSGVAMVVSSTWNVARLSPILNKHRLSLDSSCQLVHDQPSLHLPVSSEKTTLSVSTWRHAST
eukprot:scpid36519/ scgid5121/ Iron(II)-dependent oxidoreductase EgtB